ncbi:MAG: hypothetical protein HOO96_02700 [Polyangiaceae bacterium]|nr:hypothetical protein [Polyangiaceae bacterium]
MSKEHVCVNCHKIAPETSTDFTLISVEFGWRLRRQFNADGSLDLAWRCPDCWKKFKAKTPGA